MILNLIHLTLNIACCDHHAQIGIASQVCIPSVRKCMHPSNMLLDRQFLNCKSANLVRLDRGAGSAIKGIIEMWVRN